MIKNVIFDFGQVMIRFDPAYMVGCEAKDAEDAALLEAVVFDRLYWDPLDAGTITDEDAVAAMKTRLPARLHDVAERIYYGWIYRIPEIDGMRDLVRRLREDYGLRTFLLSNISAYFAKHSSEIPCLTEFDTCFFSAVLGMTKPNREIYEHLCTSMGINKEECLFIDDSPLNIRGAEAYGIKGYLFDGDVVRLSTYLAKLLEE